MLLSATATLLSLVTILSSFSDAQQAQHTHVHVKYTIARGDDTDSLLTEAIKLKQWVAGSKPSANLVKFVSDLVLQLNKTHAHLQHFAEKAAEEARRVPRSFTEGKKKVAEMKKLRCKRCTMKRLTADQLKKSATERDFKKKPFIVTNGTDCCINSHDLRRWTAERHSKLLYCSEVATDGYHAATIMVDHVGFMALLWVEGSKSDTKRVHPSPPKRSEYSSLTKVLRSMSGKEFQKVMVNLLTPKDKQMAAMGVAVPKKDITFSGYLSKCFFNRLPGSETENCEVELPVKPWLPKDASLDFNTRYDRMGELLVKANSWTRLMTWQEYLLEAGWSDITSIIEAVAGDDLNKRNHLFNAFTNSDRKLVVGPSGSGGVLKRTPMGEAMVDSLLHGSRRWVIIPHSELLRVSETAREALEPTSAFMFFEEKFVELREEFGLRDYKECQQNPGDVVFVPKGSWSVTLSTTDSISIRESYVNIDDTEALAGLIHRRVFDPDANVYSKIFCLDEADIGTQTTLTAGAKKAFLKSITEESPLLQALEVIGVLSSCAGVQYAFGGRIQGIECDDITWVKCRAKLEELVQRASSEKGASSALRHIDTTFPYIPITMPGPIPPPVESDTNENDHHDDEL